MDILYYLIPALLLLVIVAQPFLVQKRNYRYRPKKYLMTRAELDLYKKLVQIANGRYIIVPQVRLSSLFDERVKGQNWKAALSHINQKSVDFVLLDSTTYQIYAAIECDDPTHNRADRQSRDVEVNRIFSSAGLPLFRIRNSLHKSAAQIKKELDI